jgi:hypothetical protein
VTYHLALQARQNKLDTKDHQQNTDKEQRLITNQLAYKDTPSNDKEVYEHTK